MNLVIEKHDSHKDLGVLMSASGRFCDYINNLFKKVKKKISWACRSFVSRDIPFMRRLYNAQIRPHIDNCAQDWAPCEGPDLDKVEKLLYNYTKLCPSIHHLPYSERLQAMKLTSIQRRFDRYRILYVRKCLLGLVPNCGFSVIHKASHRNGVMVGFGNKKACLI